MDYVIPANDDGVRAVRLIVGVMANAVLEGNGEAVEPYVLPEEEKTEEAPVHTQKPQRPEHKPRKAPRAPKEGEAVKVEEEKQPEEVVEETVKAEESAE